MNPQTDFLWKPALRSDWKSHCADVYALLDALDHGDAHNTKETSQKVELAVRALASQRLGVVEQVKLEKLCSRLWRHKEFYNTLRPFRLGLIGNRTLSFLSNAISVAGLTRGLLIEAVEAPYNSAEAMAMGGSNPFRDEGLDAILLYLNDDAFAVTPGLLSTQIEADNIENAKGHLTQLVEGIKCVVGAPVIVTTLAQRSDSMVSSAELATRGSRSRFIQAVNAFISDDSANTPWITWDVASLASQIGLNRWYDPIRMHIAKSPFAVELSPLVADHLCRVISAMVGKTGRALVLDLDNTLWGGTIGDDGLAGIKIGQGSAAGEAYLEFQKLVLNLRERGVVLAVCSKNNDEIAREPFLRHPDMLIKEEDIAVFQSNWLDKASNIRAIAETLNLGLESLVFVDDNPAERERVRQELPLVKVPEIGDEPSHYTRILVESGFFEHLPLNNDDLQRANTYQARAKAAEVKTKIGNYDDYLTSLEMRLTINAFDDVGLPRIVQLINKSNQFNLTTRRYNSEDCMSMKRDPNKLCIQARLRDKFGDHGMIAVVIVEKAAEVWKIDSWLQSCRILERGVEQCLMNHVFSQARNERIKQIMGEYKPTDRNTMVAGFYEKMNFTPNGQDSGEHLQWVFDVEKFQPFKTFISVSDSHE